MPCNSESGKKVVKQLAKRFHQQLLRK